MGAQRAHDASGAVMHAATIDGARPRRLHRGRQALPSRNRPLLAAIHFSGSLTMKAKPSDIALALFGAPFETLDNKAQRVAQHIAERKHIAKDISQEQKANSTFGQRAADAVAAFGGSWTFIGLFGATLVCWVGLNSFFLGHYGRVFDSYPYILLNLVLSMLAAVQAPIILMSQNRQAQKDRLVAEHDYEVNLKAELEIMLLHEKIDRLREDQWTALLAIQQEQIRLLEKLLLKEVPQ
jgi:uncharacterized membrane protein